MPPKDINRIPPTFTHTFTPNDPDDPYAPDKVTDTEVLQELGNENMIKTMFLGTTTK